MSDRGGVQVFKNLISRWAGFGHWNKVVLCLIFFLAVALRLYGVDFGLPYLYHPDEAIHVEVALRMLKEGDPNPHFFKKPSFEIYLICFAHLLYSVINGLGESLALLAHFIPTAVALGVGKAFFPEALLWSRIGISLLCALTIPVIYLMGAQIYNRRVGLLAALFLALSPSHALLQFHSTNSDVPMILFLMLSFFFSYLAFESGRWRDFILAGFFAGLTIASKYNGISILLPFSLAWLFGPRSPDLRLTLRYLLLSLAAVALGFLIVTPFALLSPREFLPLAVYDFVHYSKGHPGMSQPSWLWYARYLFLESDGPIAILGGLGMIQAFLARERKVLFLLVFPAVYYVVISLPGVHFDRIAVPLVPFLALFGANLVDSAVQGAKRKFSLLNRRTVLLYLLAVLLIAPLPLARTLKGDWLLTQKDVRTIAAEWIEANIPPGSRIVAENYSPTLGDEYEISYVPEVIAQPPEVYVEHGFEYIIVSQAWYGRYYEDPITFARQVERYEGLARRFPLVREFVGPFLINPDYAIRLYAVTP